MVLLHGDHVAVQRKSGIPLTATLGSHELGSPCTILARGQAYDLYNSWMIDVLGDSGRAEW